jgi:hypothetical protein
MIDKDTFYFKHVDVPCIEKEIEDFKKVYYTADVAEFKRVDNINHVRILMPSVFDWFDKRNIEVYRVFVISHLSGQTQNRHIDAIHNDCRLAINLLLTPESKKGITKFFELKDPNIIPELLLTEDTNLPYSKYNDSDLIPVTYYSMESPILLNTSKIHSVMNITRHHRSVVSFRFKEDPWFLTEEHV